MLFYALIRSHLERDELEGRSKELAAFAHVRLDQCFSALDLLAFWSSISLL